jgi:hypothetical protein
MEDQERAASQHDVYSHPSPVEHWRHLIEIVALTVAALWGFYVFVYQERIKPAHEAPAVDVVATLRHDPMRSGRELVYVDLPFKNIGNVEVQYLGAIVNAYGIRFSSQDQKLIVHSGFATKISRTLAPSRPVLLMSELLRYSQIGGMGHFFEAPGAERKAVLYFAVASGKYDAVRVDSIYCVTRSDNTAQYPFKPAYASDGAFDRNSFDALVHVPGVECNGVRNQVFTV